MTTPATGMTHWGALIERASRGWAAHGSELARGVVNMFNERLRADADVLEIGNSFVSFITALHGIHLRGMDAMACLLVGGTEHDAEAAVRRFWSLASGPQQLALVLALTEDAARIVHRNIPDGFAC